MNKVPATTDSERPSVIDAPETLPPADDDAEMETQPTEEADAPAQPEPRLPPAAVSPQMAARERIAARWSEHRKQEAEDEAGDGHSGPDPDAIEATAQPEADAARAGTPPTEPTTQEPAAEPEIDLTIDGKKVKKPLSEVIALAQMNGAADNRLDESKRLLREAIEVHKKATEHPPAPQQHDEPHQPPSTESENPPTAIDRDELKSIVERIQVGDVEEGAQALLDFVAKMPANKPVSQDEMVGVIRQFWADQELRREADTAIQKFAKDFEDVVADNKYQPVIEAGIADEMRRDLQKLGVTDDVLRPLGNDVKMLKRAHDHARLNGAAVRSYGEILTSVGDYVQKNFVARRQSDPADPQNQRTEPRRQPPQNQRTSVSATRQERKQGAFQQPRTAGIRMPAPQPPQPKTVREKIAEMKQQRGFR